MACGFFLTALNCVQMSEHSKLGDIKLLAGAELKPISRRIRANTCDPYSFHCCTILTSKVHKFFKVFPTLKLPV